MEPIPKQQNALMPKTADTRKETTEMHDLLTLGATLYHRQMQRTDLEKARAAEAAQRAKIRLRQAWDVLVGEHANAIRAACDSALLDAELCGQEFKPCRVTLTRGNKISIIYVDYGTSGGPRWRPDGWASWQRPNPDELTLYIWDVFYDEHEQRNALAEITQ